MMSGLFQAPLPAAGKGKGPRSADFIALDAGPRPAISSFRDGRFQFQALWPADVRAAKKEIPGHWIALRRQKRKGVIHGKTEDHPTLSQGLVREIPREV